MLQHMYMHGSWPFRGNSKAKQVKEQAEDEAKVRRLWVHLIREESTHGNESQLHKYRKMHKVGGSSNGPPFPPLSSSLPQDFPTRLRTDDSLLDAAREHVRAYTLPEYYQASLQWRMRVVWEVFWIVAFLVIFVGVCR